LEAIAEVVSWALALDLPFELFFCDVEVGDGPVFEVGSGHQNLA
jgi:hypothetical protein